MATITEMTNTKLDGNKLTCQLRLLNSLKNRSSFIFVLSTFLYIKKKHASLS